MVENDRGFDAPVKQSESVNKPFDSVDWTREGAQFNWNETSSVAAGRTIETVLPHFSLTDTSGGGKGGGGKGSGGEQSGDRGSAMDRLMGRVRVGQASDGVNRNDDGFQERFEKREALLNKLVNDISDSGTFGSGGQRERMQQGLREIFVGDMSHKDIALFINDVNRELIHSGSGMQIEGLYSYSHTKGGSPVITYEYASLQVKDRYLQATDKIELSHSRTLDLSPLERLEHIKKVTGKQTMGKLKGTSAKLGERDSVR